MRQRKYDKLWQSYLRISKIMSNYSENSTEWHELNKVAWEIIGKYVSALLKEL